MLVTAIASPSVTLARKDGATARIMPIGFGERSPGLGVVGTF